MFPNIIFTGNELTIKSTSQLKDFTISNLAGFVITNQVLENSTNEYKFTLPSNIQPGLYFVHLTSMGGHTVTRKLIIE